MKKVRIPKSIKGSSARFAYREGWQYGLDENFCGFLDARMCIAWRIGRSHRQLAKVNRGSSRRSIFRD